MRSGLFVDIGDHNRCTFVSKFQRDCTTDPCCTTGYYRHLSLKVQFKPRYLNYRTRFDSGRDFTWLSPITMVQHGFKRAALVREWINVLTVSRKQALEYAYKLLEKPRSHLRVELNQDKSGVSVTHKGRVITRVFLNRSGMNAAVAMSEAMAIKLPALGKSNSGLVSTGLLYRVLALSQLDFRNPAAYELAAELVDEAISMQRGSSSTSGV